MPTSTDSTATAGSPGRSNPGRGLAFLTVTGLAWGTTGAAADLVYRVSDLGPMAVSFWRHAGGLALLLVFARLATRSAHRRPSAPLRRRAALLCGTGLAMAVFQTAYFAAVQSTGVAVATIVTLGSGPILTAIGGRIFLRERIGPGAALAVVGALTGLVILVGGNGTGAVTPAGVGLSALSAAGYATGTLLGRQTGRSGHGEHPYTLTLWSFAVGAVALLPLALFEGPLPSSGDTAATAALLAYLAVFTTALAYPLYFAGTARVRATTAAVMMLIEPVTASLLAVTVLNEPMTVATAVGALVLLSSIAALAYAESRRPA